MKQSSNPCRVLCVDDNAQRQLLYESHLGVGDAGYALMITESTGEALSLIQTFRPDCILAANRLADMDTKTFLTSVHDAGLRKMPIATVLIAGGAEETDAAAAMKGGAQDYILEDALTGDRLHQTISNAITIVTLQRRLDDARCEKEVTEFRDPMTGLATRNLFLDRLTHAIIIAKRNAHYVGILMVELDALKDINVVHGHADGDKALCEVAKRLKDSLRDADTIARMSGNRFAVLMETGATPEGTMTTAGKIAALMEEPLTGDEGPLDLSLNIGITIFPNHGEDSDALLRNAELAAFQAAFQDEGYAMFTHDDATAPNLEGKPLVI